jgi:hypothetical protein
VHPWPSGKEGWTRIFTRFANQHLDTEIRSALTEMPAQHAGPGRDLVLAWLSDLGLEKTGVIAGMSGSPVYIDGKLLAHRGRRRKPW